MSEKIQVKIKIYSLIDNLDDSGLTVGDSEISESVYDGFFEACADAAAIEYEERADDGNTVSCTVKAEGERVYVRRFGAVDTEMIFEQGLAHTSLYKVSPFSFDMTVTARKIRGTLSLGSTLELIYSMEIGGAKKDCRMKITVNSVGGIAE